MPGFGWSSLKNLNPKRQNSGTDAESTPATKCESCEEILIKKALEENLGVCPSCDHHHRLDADARLAAVLDPDSFEECDADLGSKDILDFRALKSYEEYLDRAIRQTRTLSAFRSGYGRLGGRRVSIGACESRFIMASMGSVLGEKFVRGAERAAEDGLPYIVFACSGGARMHEGLYSLMQMAKTSAALAKLDEARLPYIVVCTDPTTAGVWASWASLGDIILAEPGALIGFTGARVIKATINCELPEDFQTAEFLLEHGQIDMIVHRRDLRTRLLSILAKLCGPVEAEAAEA